MKLNDYLSRIDYTGSLEPTKETLFDLHAAHRSAIAYENLDIHLGNRLTLDLDHIFDKIVHQGRGGWCFEMNGLFGWALEEIGFSITRLGATVGRENRDDGREGDHLILLVHLEQSYLADVGFGAGFLDPLLLTQGSYPQSFLTFGLEKEGDYWIFRNDPAFGVGFDFTLEPKTMGDFANQCDWLQTSPDSGFVKTTVCHRMTRERISSLRGVILKTVKPSHIEHQLIETQAQYDHCLRSRFDLTIEPVDNLWSSVQQRHQTWLAAEPNALGNMGDLQPYKEIEQS